MDGVDVHSYIYFPLHTHEFLYSMKYPVYIIHFANTFYYIITSLVFACLCVVLFFFQAILSFTSFTPVPYSFLVFWLFWIFLQKLHLVDILPRLTISLSQIISLAKVFGFLMTKPVRCYLLVFLIPWFVYENCIFALLLSILLNIYSYHTHIQMKS